MPRHLQCTRRLPIPLEGRPWVTLPPNPSTPRPQGVASVFIPASRPPRAIGDTGEGEDGVIRITVASAVTAADVADEAEVARRSGVVGEAGAGSREVVCRIRGNGAFSPHERGQRVWFLTSWFRAGRSHVWTHPSRPSLHRLQAVTWNQEDEMLQS